MTDAIYQVFLWLDDGWERFWITAWISFAAVLITSLLPCAAGTHWRRWNHPALYCTLVLLALVAFRWPMIGAGIEFNPDESQLLAGAITTWHRHVIWSIDMGYCGPWAFLPLTLPAMLGLPIDYLSGRCVALLMTWSTIVFLWLTFRHFFADRLARMLVLPLVCLMSFTRSEDFVQYSGEQSPLFYFSVALWLLLTAFDDKGLVVRVARLFLGGVFIGMLPFSKLQVAPIGVLLAVFFLAAIFRQQSQPLAKRVRQAAWLVAGALLMLGFTISCIAASGSLFHFYKSYLVMGLVYAGIRAYENSEFLPLIWQLSKTAWGVFPFLWPTTAAIALALPFTALVKVEVRRLLPLGGLLFLSAYFIVWAPGRDSPHYLLFFIIPTAFLLGVFYGGLITNTHRSAWQRRGLIGFFLAVCVVPQIYSCYSADTQPYVGNLGSSREYAIGPVAKTLLPLMREGDTLTVWGWACTYYVQTQLPQGTRESHTERQIVFSPEQEYFRMRFLADMEREPPVFFLDAIGEGHFRFTDRNVFAHDRWTALQTVINRHYQQIDEKENTRIYMRRDRLAEQPEALK
ncbi:hypothetical protein [Oleiharenicola lentus]|uniref:hypothetical protein n=1 Tax=Oleiharenicola lentus TaxID=2508720 RepID=UPI003F67D64C